MITVAADKIVFRVYNPFAQFDIVKEIWVSLLEKSHHSYFQSWPWKELWIESLPPNCKLSFTAGFIDGSPIVAFYFGSKTVIRNNFFRFHQLSQNSIFNPDFDALYTEDDNFLIDPEITISIESLLEHIPVKWDNFTLLTYAPIYHPNLILKKSMGKDYNLYITDRKSYFVDLEKIRRCNNDYLSMINPKKRSQIRSSIRQYEKIGKIRVSTAENMEDAYKIFDELIILHQKKWTERGKPGIFSNKYIIDFHRNLISRRFASGEIQLIRVSAGDHTIACRYGFAYKGKVISYISGTNYELGGSFNPGYISHYFAILHYAEKGYDRYKLLEGEDEHKIILSTDYIQMHNIAVRKRNIAYKTERLIVNIMNLLKIFVNIGTMVL